MEIVRAKELGVSLDVNVHLRSSGGTTYDESEVYWVLFEIVFDVLLRWERRDKDVVEAFACVLGRSVLGRTLEIEDVWFSVRVEALSLERAKVVVQIQSILGRD